MGTDFFLPLVSDVNIYKPVKGFLAWWLIEEQRRMRKIVFETVPYFIEPVPVVLAGKSVPEKSSG